MEERQPTGKTRGSRAEIAAEVTVVLATLAGLAGSTALVISMYRDPPGSRKERPEAASPIPVVVEAPAEVASPAAIPPTSPTPEAIDPTPAALAEQADREREHRELAARAEGEAAALEAARQATKKRADSARRGTAAIRSKAAELREMADHGEIDAEMLALERDMLARELDRKKADLGKAQARARNGYAIQPYRGPNGTWRCPVVVECTADMLAMPPNGPAFSTLDLGRGPSELRAFLVALNRATSAIARMSGPDGGETVPYVLFVVRPDGIRPYYAAKALLEPMGVAFGYELVGQGVEVDYPDLGDPSSWPDVGPLAASPNTRPTPGLSQGRPGSARGVDAIGELARARPPRHQVPGDRLFGDENPYGPAGLVPAEEPPTGGRPRSGRLGLDPPSPGFVPRGRALEELSRSGEAPTMPGGRQPPTLSPRVMPGVPDLATLAPAASGGSDRGESAGQPGASGSRGVAGHPGGQGRSVPTGGSGADGEPRHLPIIPDVPSKEIELVVVCSRDSILIHPGAYRLMESTLKSQPSRLVADLKAIVAAERVKHPGMSMEPRLRFLVQAGGQATYELARGQTLAGGIDWPSRVQVANVDPLRLTRGEPEP
ncbi:MAG: hypothetical protein U0800_23355 [Isosphaeraceae bacterium]